MYGTHLGPEPACGEPTPYNGPYPLQACGVRVTAGGKPAGLMFVGPNQINLKLPADLPDGPAPVQVCLHDLCSAPVVKQFSTHTALIHVQEPESSIGYVHMPIWIDVDLPYPYKLPYPCGVDPWDFHGPRMDNLHHLIDYKVEVRKHGALLSGAPKPRSAEQHLQFWDCINPFGFGSQSSRFPLHLAYRLESPGLYEIQLTGWQGSDIVVQSAWTGIEIKPCPTSTRDAWLRSVAERIKSDGDRELIRDIIPSLLAWPDHNALATLWPVYRRLLGPQRLKNRQVVVYAFLKYSLAGFDEDVLHSVIPAADLNELCPPQGRCGTR